MNAAQRRSCKRQVKRDWPPGTRVTWGRAAEVYHVVKPSSYAGLLVLRNIEGRQYGSVAPAHLKRVPE